MEDELDKVAQLKDKLNRGDYAVDPGKVADAILRRWRDIAAIRAEFAIEKAPDGPESQSECSYPTSLADAAKKSRRPGSSVTRPTQVKDAFLSALESAASMIPRAAGGAQTQS